MTSEEERALIIEDLERTATNVDVRCPMCAADCALTLGPGQVNVMCENGHETQWEAKRWRPRTPEEERAVIVEDLERTARDAELIGHVWAKRGHEVNAARFKHEAEALRAKAKRFRAGAHVTFREW